MLSLNHVKMLLHECHWTGCSTTWLRCKRNSSSNNWYRAAEDPILFSVFLNRGQIHYKNSKKGNTFAYLRKKCSH